MRRTSWAPAIAFVAVAFLLQACATFNPFDVFNPAGRSVLQGGTSITAMVDQPIGRKEMASIDAAYRTAVVAAVNYRRYCFAAYQAAPTQLPGICENWMDRVRSFRTAKNRVRPVLTRLRNFVRTNDTVSAKSAALEAWAVIQDFRNSVPTVGVQ